MKTLTLIVCLFSLPTLAMTLDLTKGEATYEVRHLIKKVSGRSTELKGKMVCEGQSCDFLIGAPVKTFVSSDSNRDSNMQTVAETAKFPITTASGKIPAEALSRPGTFDHEVRINFHGVERSYQTRTEVLANRRIRSSFTLKLDQHGVERPSLFGVKITDEVPMTFDLVLEEKEPK